ncbi:MAG: DUF3775 domain-containing protein [Sphingomonadales bacterium]|nr:MAG: DUF3775 domain-containing protein [Sphingomonadales bacterium]
MAFTITHSLLREIVGQAQAVEADILRFFEPHEVDGMGEDAFLSAGQKLDLTLRQRLTDTLSGLDDVMLAEVAAISLAGDGSYAPDEIAELVGSLLERTDRNERMRMLTNEPLIGSMLANGMSALGLDA